MVRFKQWIWCIGICALVIDAGIRLIEYSDAVFAETPVDAVAHEELDRALNAVGSRSYRAGYLAGMKAAREGWFTLPGCGDSE